MRSYTIEITAASDISETASATIAQFDMLNYKEFDVTVHCSSSSGFKYVIYGSPVAGSAISIAITAVDFSAACGTIINTIRNNNYNNFWIEAEATAAAREISGSEITVIVTAIRE